MRRLGPLAEVGFIALLGGAQTIAYVHTSLWPLQLLAIALLAWRVGAATPWRAALLGWAFGTAWLCAGTWWMYVSMHRYGGLPAGLAAFAVFALSAFLSLYLAAAMAAVARWRRSSPLASAAMFAGAWLLAELARGVIFTGFPWVASGYAHVDSPFGGFAPWIGVYGLGAIVAGVAAAFGFSRLDAARRLAGARSGAARRARPRRRGRPHRLHPAGRHALGVAAAGQRAAGREVRRALHAEALASTAAQLESARGDLVIGPETVIPLLPEQVDPAWWGALLDRFRRPGRAALIGLPLGNEQLGYTNSAAGISAATADLPGGFYRYDKHHLVPFGEFIPTGFRWFTRMMNIPLGDFNRGRLRAPSFAVGGQQVAPNICYEDLFGEELAARFVPEEEAPTILANLSNIGWFGETIAVDQHLQISRMRSLELQRPMVRATNTGATAVIDHRGQVATSLPPFRRGTLDARVEGRSGLTPFALWAGTLGLWPLWAIGVATLLAAGLGRRAASRP